MRAAQRMIDFRAILFAQYAIHGDHYTDTPFHFFLTSQPEKRFSERTHILRSNSGIR
jgi:hypothetical protein